MLSDVNNLLIRSTAKEIIGGGLHQFVDDFQSRLNDIGIAIGDTFFQVKLPAQSGSKGQTQSQSQTVEMARS